VELLDLMRELADTHRVTVGVVLHDLDQAASVADHLVLLHSGWVRASGPPRQVLDPDLLSEIYGIRVDVTVDDRTGRLTTRARGRHI
jgi:iron complex transport system ATP-binding protein